MSKQPYNPSDIDRCTAACAYDNAYRHSDIDQTYTPSMYEADGATVTTKEDGCTYWVVTLQEAKEVGILFEPHDTVTVGRRKWVVTLA
jgi:hypothetical protein